MIEVHTVEELQKVLAPSRGKSIGLVPTMGFLHQGHLSLVTLARHHTQGKGPIVVSIFVNPTQFNDSSDFEKYPIDLESDRRLLQDIGTDILYLPKREEMYPAGCSTTVKAGALSNKLEGAFRPGHFDGVVTVVSILFHQVQPTFAVFGEEDFQQAQVINQLVRDLSIPIEILIGPIVRESSGLAMSPRNSRLTAEAKKLASQVYETLSQFVVTASTEKSSNGKGFLKSDLEKPLQMLPGVTLEYVEIIDEQTLEPITVATESARIVTAYFVEGVRLIDTVAIERPNVFSSALA